MNKEKIKTEIETKDNCYYYSWGGNISKGFPTYPRAYGARCMYFNEFFNSDGPDCKKCRVFEENEEIKKEARR